MHKMLVLEKLQEKLQDFFKGKFEISPILMYIVT
jgi:hypothetical protein